MSEIYLLTNVYVRFLREILTVFFQHIYIYQADIKCADGVQRPKSFCEAKIDDINK